MQAADVVAVIAAVSVAVLVGSVATMIASLSRTLRDLRAATEAIGAEAVPLIEDLRAAVRDAAREVDRVERLVTAAESVTDAVDSAQRLAYRTLASPVVKAMAFGAGVSRGTQRLREGDDGVPAPAIGDAGASRANGDGSRRESRRGRGRRGRRGRRRGES